MPVRSEKADSVRVEKITEYIERIRIDTAYVDIPTQSAEFTGQDSSHLETDFAVSNARINSDGTLYHDLNNKKRKYAVTIPAVNSERIVVRDSIVYRDRLTEVPVKFPLTAWEKFLKWSGIGGWFLLLFIVVWKVRRKII